MINNKVISETALVGIINRWRTGNQRIGFTCGCFDLLHSGHAAYLQAAKTLADKLIVAVNSDLSVKSLGKGDGRPVNKAEDRAYLLAALESVDFVFVFDDMRATRLLQTYRPDIFIKGGDYTLAALDKSEVEAVESYGGRIEIVPQFAGSTSRMIERIKRI